MTVRDLIKELNKHSDELEVFACDLYNDVYAFYVSYQTPSDLMEMYDPEEVLGENEKSAIILEIYKEIL